MRAFFAAVSLVIACLLASIAYELHQANRHLSAVSAPIVGFAALGADVRAGDTPEQRERRIAARVKAIQEGTDESAEVFRRALTATSASAEPTRAPSQTPPARVAPRHAPPSR